MTHAFTGVRDALEGAASVVGNWILPGSSLITDLIVSKGAQKILGSPLGQLAQIGSGFAGGIGEGGDTVGERLSTLGNDVGFSGSTVGTAASASSAGLDTIGNMVQNVPEGMTADQYAQSLGYPTGDAWLQATGGAATPASEAELMNQTNAQQTQQTAGAASGAKQPVSFRQMLGDVSGGNFNTALSYMTQGGPFAGITNTAGSAGAMPWGSAGNLFSLATGAYGLFEGDELQKQAKLLAARSDPFASQRAGYAQQLQALESNPGAVLPTLPGYKAGLDAVQRSMAAQGYNGSGNMMAALQQYGGNAYNQEASMLAGLAGAQFSPANAALINLNGQTSGANLTMNSLGLLGRTIGAA